MTRWLGCMVLAYALLSACGSNDGAGSGGLARDSGSVRERDAGAQQCDSVCSTPGEKRCEQGISMTCARDARNCLVWQRGEACEAPQCEGACAKEGVTRCDDGKVHRCVRTEEGCLAWQEASSCALGKCADASSCAQCDNRCAQVGQTSCERGVLRTCAADQDGCRDWGVGASCTGGFCADAASCGICEHRCNQVGETSCTNGRLRTCVADANGCRNWSATSACTSGFCADAVSCGACAHQCSRVGDTSCAQGRLSTCVADANGCRAWSAATTCSSGFCASATSCGNCTHRCNQVGATFCTQGDLATCVADANGCRDWTARTTCAEGFCASATTCGQCTHRCDHVGATSCAQGKLSTCVADQNGCRNWDTGTSCRDGFCADERSCGSCDHGCSRVGETSCADGRLTTCVAGKNGCRSWDAGMSCGEGFCADAKQCGVCDDACSAGATSCLRGELTTCVADANGCFGWSAAKQCAAGVCGNGNSCFDCASPIFVDADSKAINPTGESWITAFTSLRAALAALDARPAGCETTEIWVAEGRYTPGTSSSDYLEASRAVEIYGGFAGDETRREQRQPAKHRTVVTGDLLGDDTPRGNRSDNAKKLLALWSGAASRLDGLTFYGASPSDPFAVAVSAGVQLLTVENVVFAGTRKQGNDLIGVLGGAGTLVVRDSVFVANDGEQIRAGGRFELDGVLIADARPSWFGVRQDEPSVVRNSMIIGTRGGANRTAFMSYAKGGTMENTLIAGNETQGLRCDTLHGTNLTLFGNKNGHRVDSVLSATNSVIPAGLVNGASIKNYTGDAWSAFAPSISGTWAATSRYDASSFQTTFTMAEAAFATDALKGRLLAPRSGEFPWAFIAGNDGAQLRVWGDYDGIGARVAFDIYDLRPNPSGPLVDAAADELAPCGDIVGMESVDVPSIGGQGTRRDIGAYEAAGAPVAQCGCDECPSEGQPDCYSGSLRTCKRGANGCLVWSQFNKCETSSCNPDGRTCTPRCVDACAALNQTECNAGNTRKCTMGSEGCLLWSGWSSCESGSCASSANCTPNCRDSCPQDGQTQCRDGKVRTCRMGGEGCLAWSAQTACATGACSDGTKCSAGSASGVCDRRTNAQQCFEYTGSGWTNETAKAQCTADGTWASICPDGSLVGKCVDQGGSGSPQATTVWFYAGGSFTAAELQDLCVKTGGTWK